MLSLYVDSNQPVSLYRCWQIDRRPCEHILWDLLRVKWGLAGFGNPMICSYFNCDCQKASFIFPCLGTMAAVFKHKRKFKWWIKLGHGRISVTSLFKDMQQCVFRHTFSVFWLVNLGGPGTKESLCLSSWGPKQQMLHIIVLVHFNAQTNNTQCSSSNSQDPFGVAVGGTLGHCMCTGLAVIGGRMIAQKISVRTGETLFTFCFINNNKCNIFIYTSIEGKKNPSNLVIC